MASPLIYAAAAQLFYFLGLTVKPSPYRWLFMVPITLSVASFFRFPLQYRSYDGYTFANIILLQFFAAVDYILLTDVQRELSSKTQKEPAYKLPFTERVKWAASLITNSRCVGWSHEPTHALPRRRLCSTSRSKFVIRESLCLALEVALSAALTGYMKSNPSKTTKGFSLAGADHIWLPLGVIVFWAKEFTNLDIPHRILSILGVASGVVEQQDCVPLFGSFYESYSLRNFWGRVWHQNFRRPLSSFGRFVAYDLLHLKAGSLVSYLVHVYVGFAMSGLIHATGDYAFLGYWSYKPALRFFLLQAVGIHIEVLLQRNFSTPEKHWRWLGYLWVFAWFAATLPLWADGVLPLGYYETSPMLPVGM